MLMDISHCYVYVYQSIGDFHKLLWPIAYFSLDLVVIFPLSIVMYMYTNQLEISIVICFESLIIPLSFSISNILQNLTVYVTYLENLLFMKETANHILISRCYRGYLR